MPENDAREKAVELFRRGYERQMQGEYREAIELYTDSIETLPTAEAYTFRGWAYSFLGDYDRAIAECEEAIKVDPEFGNPYNDIGAYLIEKGKLEEAIPWLKKATVAERYEARCYPYFNLGRVYERKHDWSQALRSYRKAYELDPRYIQALAAYRRIQVMMN